MVDEMMVVKLIMEICCGLRSYFGIRSYYDENHRWEGDARDVNIGFVIGVLSFHVGCVVVCKYFVVVWWYNGAGAGRGGTGFVLPRFAAHFLLPRGTWRHILLHLFP